MSMILYRPNYVHSSQLIHICNRESTLSPNKEPQQLQIHKIHAMMESTIGWKKICMHE